MVSGIRSWGGSWAWIFVLAGSGCSDDDGQADADVSGTMGTGGTETGEVTTGATSSVDTGASGMATSAGGGSGCDGVSLRRIPADPSLRGPWSVGVRTGATEDLTVEVWYPAEPGVEADSEPVVYDIRAQLPDSEMGKIPDDQNPAQPCECYRDLPIDDAYGPYPVLVFVHGTAGFRTQSLHQMTHWASRGFVVVAADHPGLNLRDTLGPLCGETAPRQDLAGDVAAVLSAVRGETAGLEWLTAAVDADHVGLAGHSAGGTAVGELGDEGQIIVPMAAGGVGAGVAVISALVLGGTADSVVDYDEQVQGYEGTAVSKRLVGLDNAGHLAFSEICSLQNAAGEDLLTIAQNNDVCGAQLAGFLFQCGADLLADPEGWEIVDYTTSAAFEETLHCRDIGDAFADLQGRFPAVAEFREDL